MLIGPLACGRDGDVAGLELAAELGRPDPGGDAPPAPGQDRPEGTAWASLGAERRSRAAASHENHWHGAGVGCEDVIGGRLRSGCLAGLGNRHRPVRAGPRLLSQAARVMARRLFTVEDTFAIRERGLVLAPGIIPEGEERFRVGDPITLLKPDGSSIEAKIGGLELLDPNPRRDVVIMLAGMTKSEVPVGTEVWSVDI